MRTFTIYIGFKEETVEGKSEGFQSGKLKEEPSKGTEIPQEDAQPFTTNSQADKTEKKGKYEFLKTLKMIINP